MIFSVSDIELLRMVLWCGNIHPATLKKIFKHTDIEHLQLIGFLRSHLNSGTLILTDKGYQALSALDHSLIPRPNLSYREDLFQRRLQTSLLATTAYRAGIEIFTSTVKGLAHGPAMFNTTIGRGRERNIWGNSRIASLFHLDNVLYGAYHISSSGQLNPDSEVKKIETYRTISCTSEIGLFFVGETYKSIQRGLKKISIEKTHMMSYGAAFEKSQSPVHLLSCDDVGTMQLKIMAVPSYRTVFTRAALVGHYTPPPKNTPAWDAIYDGKPFVMAADMDLRRVDAALQLAAECGLGKIAIVGLEGQTDTVLGPCYQDTGKADVYVLKEHVLKAVLGDHVEFYVPPDAPYFTEEGDVIYAPSIKAAGKAGGYHHK